MSTLHLVTDPTAIHAQTCGDVASAASPSDSDVVVVALAGSPARWFDQWIATVDPDVDRATFVVPDDADWRAGTPRDRIEAVSPSDSDVTVAAVDSPGNLTDIGVTIMEALEPYRDADEPVELCFQSLTVLLQYASLDEVYRFLHVLLANLDAFDVTGHFHLYEDAHDEKTIASLRPLFDQVRCDDCS